MLEGNASITGTTHPLLQNTYLLYSHFSKVIFNTCEEKVICVQILWQIKKAHCMQRARSEGYF